MNVDSICFDKIEKNKIIIVIQRIVSENILTTNLLKSMQLKNIDVKKSYNKILISFLLKYLEGDKIANKAMHNFAIKIVADIDEDTTMNYLEDVKVNQQ